VTISSIVLNKQTAVGFSVKCTTDFGDGTLYAIADAPGPDPTAQQVVDGQISSGVPAAAAGNIAVSSTGQTGEIALTGLSPSTPYQCWVVQDESGGKYVFATDFSGYDTSSQTLQQLDPGNFGDYFTTVSRTSSKVIGGGLGHTTTYTSTGFSHPQLLAEDQYMQFRLNQVPTTGWRCNIRSQDGPGNVNRISISIGTTHVDIRAQNISGSFQFLNVAHGGQVGVIYRFQILVGIFKIFINGVEAGSFDYGNSSSVNPYRSVGPSVVSVAAETAADRANMNLLDDFECGEL
jgi:hypothetical protein